MDISFRNRGGRQARGSADWSHSPNYLRSGFYDQIEYDEEKSNLIDGREDYYSSGEIEDEDFDRRTAEGGGAYHRHVTQGSTGQFKCIITENASFIEK